MHVFNKQASSSNCCAINPPKTLCWTADGHSEFLAACKKRAEGKLSLEHSDTDVCNTKDLCDAEGPFDVVILDMALSQLVLALMQVSSLAPWYPTCKPHRCNTRPLGFWFWGRGGLTGMLCAICGFLPPALVTP